MSEYRQITSWGHIDWLRTKATDSSAQADVGIVCLLPGKKQAEHTHYSETQFLYMLEGIGEHTIDGRRCSFAPGDYFFLPCGVRHATTNLGNTPMRELMVSIPVHLPQSGDAATGHSRSAEAADDSSIREILLRGVRQLSADTLDHLNVPLVITDTEDTVVYDSRRPDICKTCSASDCPIRSSRQELHLRQAADSGSVVCPMGLTILMQPVEAEGRTWFYLKSGLFHEYPNVPVTEGAYDVPGSTVSSIRILLQDIARYLQDHAAAALREQALNRRENAAVSEAFEHARESTLNIQIRNHFLFNALNSIASLAIRDNSMDTYTAILDLSELLRGLLRKEGARVPLSEELIFLQRYLNLQELRHEGSLNIIWNRSSSAEKVIVPHNFLQPIAENAFVHGFKNQRGIKELQISTALEGNHAVITLRDNGCGMDRGQLAALRASLSSDSPHGLSLVRRKLAGVFGMDFSMEIQSEPNEGTVFRILLPH